jgi:hypothetical protein
MVFVDIPIGDRFGQTPFKMVIGIPNDFFQAVLAAQKLPATWIPQGEGEEFRDAPTDQVHKVHLSGNVAAISAHSHSARYGWTTAIGISEADLFGQAFGLVFLSALGGFAATGFVVLLAASLLTYVAGAIKSSPMVFTNFQKAHSNKSLRLDYRNFRRWREHYKQQPLPCWTAESK